MPLPCLYPIIDFSCFAAKPDPIMAIVRYAEELIAAGATLIQLRDKSQPEQPRRFLSCARELRRVTLDKATLIINDRVDICLAADADGVHLGQDDLSPESARRIFDSCILKLRDRGAPSFASKAPESGNPRERMGDNAIGARNFSSAFPPTTSLKSSQPTRSQSTTLPLGRYLPRDQKPILIRWWGWKV